jgi:glycosyltransferase involved in cell wall biosynthesis
MGRPFAIYYKADGYKTAGRPLMGRRAAGEGFIEAWIGAQDRADLYCYADSRAEFEDFRAIVEQVRGERTGTFIDRTKPAELERAGCLYWPSPGFPEEAWRRARVAPEGWSIMGVTHTTASHAVMDSLADVPVGAVRDFDAIICTSQSVRRTVERILSLRERFLAARLGATTFVRPQLPVIPLGVNTARFRPDAARRAQTRARLGIGETQIAVLFLGRLSFHAKAHHIPMYLALERAAAATGATVHLLLCGWFANEGIEKAFREGASIYAPSIRLHVLDGRDAEVRAGAWQAADVYTSLVDNIQETFGLSPIEGMAAGLPVVVSDYDGYKDTVRDGLDGFRVPTFQPPPGEGDDLADAHAIGLQDYDRYLFATVLDVVVDVTAAARAFATLFADPDLRRRMGESGRARAQALFDWRQVVAHYRDLAGELAERRAVAARAEAGQVWPARLSPWDAFASYPTDVMIDTCPVGLETAIRPAHLQALVADGSTGLSGSSQAVAAILQVVAQGAGTVGDVVARFAPQEHAMVRRTLRRLAKFGVLTLARGQWTGV